MSHIVTANKPQRRYEYVLPQDKPVIEKEVCTLGCLTCIADIAQNKHLTHSQVKNKAFQAFITAKAQMQSEEICNDIGALGLLVTSAYTGSYLGVQSLLQSSPQMRETILNEIATHGLEACEKQLIDAIESIFAQQKDKV